LRGVLCPLGRDGALLSEGGIYWKFWDGGPKTGNFEWTKNCDLQLLTVKREIRCEVLHDVFFFDTCWHVFGTKSILTFVKERRILCRVVYRQELLLLEERQLFDTATMLEIITKTLLLGW
jgi:hypothetical protein